MNLISTQLNRYIQPHPFNSGGNEHKTVLDQHYQAYAELHETDCQAQPVGGGELGERLREDNNAIFILCCRLCTEYKRKAFLD